MLSVILETAHASELYLLCNKKQAGKAYPYGGSWSHPCRDDLGLLLKRKRNGGPPLIEVFRDYNEEGDKG